jgi:predicted ATPase
MEIENNKRSDVKITFVRDYFSYKKGQVLNFNQNEFNIIVGPNGAGKSTFIKMLESASLKQLHGRYIEIEGLHRQKTFRNIPEGFRVRRSQFVDSRKEAHLVKLNQKSHGEAWKVELNILKSYCDNDTFIMIDEPETALSIESQIELCEWFIDLKKVYKNFGCLIATHSLVIPRILSDRLIEIPSGRILDPEVYVAGKMKDMEEKILIAKEKLRQL